MVNNLFLAYFYYLCYELKEWIMLQLDLPRMKDAVQQILQDFTL